MKKTKPLASYTKVTLGTVAALSAANSADAAIVYFDVNKTSPKNTPLSVGAINLATSTYTLNNFTNPFFAGYVGSVDFYTFGSIWTQVSANRIIALDYGDTISSGATFAYGRIATPGTTPGWTNGVDTYFGLRLDAGGGNYNYGWMNVNVIQNTSSTINSFAFEDQVNTAILAGATSSAAVPEPGQVAASLLLLTGVAGYFAYRRRAGAASEPKALHDLALGARGIAEFRENKAA